MRGSAILTRLRVVLCPRRSLALRRQRQRRRTRGRCGSQDLLRPVAAGTASTGWGVDSPVAAGCCGIHSPAGPPLARARQSENKPFIVWQPTCHSEWQRIEGAATDMPSNMIALDIRWSATERSARFLPACAAALPGHSRFCAKVRSQVLLVPHYPSRAKQERIHVQAPWVSNAAG